MAQSRRTFLEFVSGVVGTIAAAIVGVPVIAAIVAPFKKTTVVGSGTFVNVGAIDALPGDGTPVKLPVVIDAPRDAWVKLPPTEVGAVFVKKIGPSQCVAYSTICPHLGCGVDYVADKKTFACPCHESAFSSEGAVSGGPSPRGLDTLETRVENGRIEVKYVRFAQGTKEKVPV